MPGDPFVLSLEAGRGLRSPLRDGQLSQREPKGLADILGSMMGAIFEHQNIDALPASRRTEPVDDAGYFCDGWGIIEGDRLQLEGQIATARITYIDYENNILTVDRELAWEEGQGVSLPYQGSAPDIGAFEYQEERITGDLNDDGEVDIQDIQLLTSVILGTETSPEIIGRANVNGDEGVDILDLQQVANIILEGG